MCVGGMQLVVIGVGVQMSDNNQVVIGLGSVGVNNGGMLVFGGMVVLVGGVVLFGVIGSEC